MSYRPQFWEHEQTGDDRLIERLEHENAKLKENLAKLQAEARGNYHFLIQSRDFILNEFCQLQVNYGQQKHEIRNLKAELEHLRGILTWIIEQYESADHLGDIDMDEARSILSDAKLKEGA